MATREFEFVKKRVAGRAVSALRIVCSSCDNFEDLDQTDSRRLPHEAAAQRFRNHGWRVGSSPRKDLCPNCQRKEIAVSQSADVKISVVKAVTPPTTKAEPPRELGRDERRLIFAEIDDRYLGPEDGYGDDWTDEKLAASLGVPRAWVTTVREEFFGPEKGDNRKLQVALDRLTIIEGDVKKEREKIAAMRAEASRFISGLGDIEKQVEQALAGLRATRDEIEAIRRGGRS